MERLSKTLFTGGNEHRALDDAGPEFGPGTVGAVVGPIEVGPRETAGSRLVSEYGRQP
ncbi:hypothetical protein HCC61_10905 [Streptomyces sp. HNM0575]|uniref:hypothetical protein n=1 Tax=Streptomyces sp. HNM0575 TaxID=2716338 RepID=UPI00145CBE4B|nr:hypothetical protein [Streptomyces sp. HNM0575]NLU73182.1 hypothetical protein [Streptomyces sp. HNM0575]